MIPRLPLELERGIFEIAALEDRQDAYRLLLVARRAHIWYVTKSNVYGRVYSRSALPAG